MIGFCTSVLRVNLNLLRTRALNVHVRTCIVRTSASELYSLCMSTCTSELCSLCTRTVQLTSTYMYCWRHEYIHSYDVTWSDSQAVKDGKRVVTAHWLNDVLLKKKMLPPWHAMHLPNIYGADKPCKDQVYWLLLLCNASWQFTACVHILMHMYMYVLLHVFICGFDYMYMYTAGSAATCYNNNESDCSCTCTPCTCICIWCSPTYIYMCVHLHVCTCTCTYIIMYM